jgi:hypothetical protein
VAHAARGDGHDPHRKRLPIPAIAHDAANMILAYPQSGGDLPRTMRGEGGAGDRLHSVLQRARPAAVELDAAGDQFGDP